MEFSFKVCVLHERNITNILINSDKDASDQDIEQYSNNLFSSIKNHIATKSLLLLTNYFVFTILENSDSLENLQLKLFKLSDQDITELFQGIQNIKIS